jgi:hypothetical protein
MRDTIDMAEEAGAISYWHLSKLKAFEALVRADEREQGQKWFDAVTAQHKAEILAEREACAKVCESEWSNVAERLYGQECAESIRAKGNT